MAEKEKEKIKLLINKKLEAVPILVVYKRENDLKVWFNELDYDSNDNISSFEVYGFLKMYLKKIERDLLD